MAWTRKAGDVMKELCSRAKKTHGKDDIEGVPTGFRDLDELFGGFRAGSLNILAGRPSMGKTMLALAIAAHAGVERKARVLYVGLEHTPEQLATYLFAMSGVDAHRLRRGRLTPRELQRMRNISRLPQWLELRFVARYTMTLAEIDIEISRLSDWDKNGSSRAPVLVVVDPVEDVDLELEEVEPYEMPDASERREHVIQGLAETARTHNTAILALLRLGRSVDRRPGHRPRMRDLPYLRQTEPHADTVLLLSRSAYYGPDPENQSADLILAKNRFGSTGAVPLRFDRTRLRFIDETAALSVANRKE